MNNGINKIFQNDGSQLAPLVVFVYNRSDKTKRLLESLSKSSLIEKTCVYIFSDGPKNDNEKQKVEKVRQTVKNSIINHVALKVNLIESENNIGLANSIINGVTKIINLHNKVIVIEDDNIVSKDFLQYMNFCLNYYTKKNNIGSIAALSSLLVNDIPYEIKNDVYLLDRICSFAWGTWKEVWNDVDWAVSDYETIKNDRKIKKEFNKSGNTRSYLLDAFVYGRVNSWAIRFDYALFKKDLLTVYPVFSKAKNMGFDGTGTHYGKKRRLLKWEKNVSKIDFSNNNDLENWILNPEKPNEIVQKEFCNITSISYLYLFLKYIKMYLLYLLRK